MRHKICLLMLLAVISGCNQSPPKTETQAEVSEDSISTFDALNAELTATKEALAKAEADKTELAAKVQTLGDEKAALEVERETINQTIASNLTRIDELELDKTQSAEAIKELDSRIANLGSDLGGLQEQLAKATSPAERAALDVKIGSLSDDLAAAIKTRNDLKTEVDASEKLIIQLRDENARLILDRDAANAKLLAFAQKVCR
ncbi:MAG TPA: hypothetical protein VK602_02680 [Phyllobacterium sp.]|nr:hypothetical protein [Phyllobacterium sp.]